MIILTPNTIIILLVVVNLGFFYGLWLFIRKFFSSFYKGFDISILILLLLLIVGRVAGLLEVGAGSSITIFSTFIQVWDLRVDYFTMLFLPAIAFQIYALNFDRMENWREYLGNFLTAGKIYIILISIVELLRAYMNKLPVNVLIFHAAVIMVMLVILFFVRLFVLRRIRPALAGLVEILLTFVVTILVLLFGQVYPTAETSLRIFVLLGLTLVSALTVLRLTNRKPVAVVNNNLAPQNRI